MQNVKLLTEIPELLIYIDGKLHITVLGGIKLTGLDRLKVTLKLIRPDNKTNAFRHNLDLYNSVQSEQLIEKASEALDISSNETSKVVNNLIIVKKRGGANVYTHCIIAKKTSRNLRL
jgi:hypothetical protein